MKFLILLVTCLSLLSCDITEKEYIKPGKNNNDPGKGSIEAKNSDAHGLTGLSSFLELKRILDIARSKHNQKIDCLKINVKKIQGNELQRKVTAHWTCLSDTRAVKIDGFEEYTITLSEIVPPKERVEYHQIRNISGTPRFNRPLKMYVNYKGGKKLRFEYLFSIEIKYQSSEEESALFSFNHNIEIFGIRQEGSKNSKIKRNWSLDNTGEIFLNNKSTGELQVLADIGNFTVKHEKITESTNDKWVINTWNLKTKSALELSNCGKPLGTFEGKLNEKTIATTFEASETHIKNSITTSQIAWETCKMNEIPFLRNIARSLAKLDRGVNPGTGAGK